MTYLLRQILMGLSQDLEARIMYVYRKANNCADDLVKLWVIHIVSVRFYDNWPLDVYNTYIADILGNSTKMIFWSQQKNQTYLYTQINYTHKLNHLKKL